MNKRTQNISQILIQKVKVMADPIIQMKLSDLRRVIREEMRLLAKVKEDVISYEELMRREPDKFPTKQSVYNFINRNEEYKVKKTGQKPLVNYTLLKSA